MDLKLAEEVLQLSISLEIMNQDTPNILDLIYKDKIFDRAIVNTKVAAKENDDIMHKARNIIVLTREWINKPFRMDPLTNAPKLHAPSRSKKGKGVKATIPTFHAHSPIQPSTVYRHARDVAYIERERKVKRKGVTKKELEEAAIV